jgi:hypothetical protein
MRRLVLLALLATTTTAHADGFYFTEGLGGTQVKDQLSRIIPDAARIRISAGERVGAWALEAWLAGTLADPNIEELDTYGIDVKYLQPVTTHLELYVRGSASIGQGFFGQLDGFSGRGLGFGAGIALRGKVSPWGLLWSPLFFLVRSGPKITGALWLDDGYEFYRLHSATKPYTIDAQLTHITFGFALGSDF